MVRTYVHELVSCVVVSLSVKVLAESHVIQHDDENDDDDNAVDDGDDVYFL